MYVYVCLCVCVRVFSRICNGIPYLVIFCGCICVSTCVSTCVFLSALVMRDLLWSETPTDFWLSGDICSAVDRKRYTLVILENSGYSGTRLHPSCVDGEIGRYTEKRSTVVSERLFERLPYVPSAWRTRPHRPNEAVRYLLPPPPTAKITAGLQLTRRLDCDCLYYCEPIRL